MTSDTARMLPVPYLNTEGLTLTRWLAAAAVPDTYAHRVAFAMGEDPSEYRAKKPTLTLAEVRGGMRVKVIARGDETLDPKYLGRIGKVVAFDPHDCGASENDPMLMVQFPGLKPDGFWLEELEAV